LVKGRTTISIDNDLVEEAQKKFLNISAVTEQAVKEKLGKVEVSIDQPEICSDCGLECPKETAEDIPSKRTTLGTANPNRLTWLYPDEIWICNACLEKRIRTDFSSGMK